MDLLAFLIISFILYTYIGYPFLVLCAAGISRKKSGPHQSRYLPTVSIVVAVRNEAELVGRRIKNLFDCNYPSELLEIVIVSDGSTDETNKVIRETFESMNCGVHERAVKVKTRLVAYSKAAGKAFALNKGVAVASGEIIVFSDARQLFDLDAIRSLVVNFEDPEVGCASGELVFCSEDIAAGGTEMGLYWKYEKLIRKAESTSGSVVGASGAIYAIRKHLYSPLPDEALLDDLLIPMSITCKGFRTIFDSSAIAYDVISPNLETEWRRKVRTLAGNWQLMSLGRHLFFPSSNPIWWKFISHKIFRILIPFMLLVFLIITLLGKSHFLKFALFAQVIFYSLAILGIFIPKSRKIRFVNISTFFLTINSAILAGMFQYLRGNHSKIWK